MIDEKGLIEDFRKCHISFNGTPMEYSDMVISYRSLVRVINNQKKVDWWISCDERLPKEEGDYFVTLYNKNAIDDYCDGYRVTKRFFDCNDWWCDIDYNFGWNLIAWQQLPDPYKGG